ncbi:uncharacterized protein akna [Eucyclogobius newberryi]|uniref:uncharacterized protein akna n=1 Tax=Eucyclogobius newberryi TaxID=166745 RepID=UPI003B5B92E0
MQTHKTPGRLFWTPAPLGRSLSSSDASGQTSEEEQGAVGAQVQHSGLEQALELALGQIGLREDELGLGPHCGEDLHSFSPLPAEGDADEGLDRGSSPAMFGTDLDVSEEGTEYYHTPTKCLDEDLTLQNRPNPLDSKPHTPSRAPSLPLISPEELASSPRIIEETLPEIWSESSSESSPRPAEPSCESHNPQTETRTLKELGAVSKIPVKMSVTQKRPSSPEDTRLSTTILPKARPRSSKSSCRSKPSAEREEKQNQAALFSPMVPSMHRFDLSKVEPRVRFPKDGYTPPKSRCPLRSVSLSPEPRLMYMSPADIVTTVLLNPLDGSDPEGEEETPAALSILPPEFRSRQQAISLMNELQEDNYRLKLKCAEAATTIDRLRLEAKVNLYSDPPEPGLPLHCGVRTQASRPVTLDIPHPQRAEFSPSSSSQSRAQHQQHKSPLSSTSSSVRRFSDLIDALRSQAQMFLQNVEACGRSLQTEKQMEKMLQRLDILERCYMFAKEEHKRLQREGAHLGNFDPERELESLIFQCDQQMDELKEQVQQKQLYNVATPTHHDPPTHHYPPPPPLQTPPTPSHAAVQVPEHSCSASSSSSSVRGVAHRLHQQKCPSASVLPGSPFTTAAPEGKPQTTLPDPLWSGGHGEPDHTELFLSLKEVCVPLVRELSCHHPVETAGPQCEYEEAKRLSKVNTQTPQRSNNRIIPKQFTIALSAKVKMRMFSSGFDNREADHSAHSSPARSSHSWDLPQRAPCTSTPLTFEPHALSRGPSRRGSTVRPSPSSSPREALHTTDHRLPCERKKQRRAQDGLISPETDSGFLGSEESRLTPAAATSPVHQREPPGVMGVPLVSPSPGPSLSRQCTEGPAVRPQPSRRGRRREKRRSSSASCSQLLRGRRRADTDGLCGHYSRHGSSTSEEDQRDHSSGSSLSSCGPSSPRHGDPLKATNTGGGERLEAFGELQAEVLRLRDNMDWFVRVRDDGRFSPSSTISRQTTVHRRRRDEDAMSQTDHWRAVSSKVSQTDHRRAVSSKVSQTDHRGAMSSDVSQTDHRGAMSSDVSQTVHRGAVSSSVSQTDHRGAVSSDVSPTDHRRAVSSSVSQTDHRGTVSSKVSQTDHWRAVSSDVSQTDHRRALSSKVSQTDHRGAVSSKVSQNDHWRAMSRDVSQTDHRGAVSSDVSQTDHRGAVSSSVSQTDHRGAVSSDVSPTDHRRAVSSSVSQTDHRGTVSSKVSQTDHWRAVSSDVSQTDHRRALSSKVSQTDHRGAVSSKVSQNDHWRAMSRDVSQTDHRGAVSSDVSQTDHRRAVSSSVSQTDHRGAVSSDVSPTDHRRAVSSSVSQTDSCLSQLVSRLTQTSAERGAHPETVHDHQRHSSERTEDGDGRAHVCLECPVCPECQWRARSRDGGVKSCHPCGLCGAAETGPNIRAEPDGQKCEMRSIL